MHSYACLHIRDHRERRRVACEHVLAAYKNEEPVYVRHSKAAALVAWWVGRLRFLKWVTVFGLVLLSCFERPVWCIRQQHADGVYPCDLPEYEGFRQGYFYLNDAFAIEGLLLTIVLILEAGQSFAGALSMPEQRGT